MFDSPRDGRVWRGRWRGVLLWAVWVFLGFTGSAGARGEETARALERTAGQARSVNETHNTADRSPAADPPLASSAESLSCERIRAVKLLGEEASLLSFALEPLTEGPERILGQCLGASQKAQALQRVHQAFIVHGYLTRLFPGQP